MAKARGIRGFSPDTPPGKSLKLILQTRFGELLSREDGAAAGDAAAVHDMRVSGRRIQSVMKVFRSCLPGKEAARAYRDVRKLVQALGTVRECDCILAQLSQYAGRERKQDPALALLAVLYRVERRRRLKALARLLASLREDGGRERFACFAGGAAP